MENEILGIISETVGGLASFLLGMNSMSDGLGKLAKLSHTKNLANVKEGQAAPTPKKKNFYNHIMSTKVGNIAHGAVMTALTQSSSATTSANTALVGANVLSKKDASYRNIGANIGTTITTYAEFLKSFKPAELMKIVAIALPISQILKEDVDFLKKVEKAKGHPERAERLDEVRYIVKQSGKAAGGLGFIFMGLGLMGDSLNNPAVVEQISTMFQSAGSNPWVLAGASALGTAVVQSSSVVTTLLAALAQGNAINVEQMMPLVVGANIGTPVTAILAALGVKENRKEAIQTAINNLAFNLIGALGFLTAMSIPDVKEAMAAMLQSLADAPALQAAYFHTGFNAISTVALTPIFDKIINLMDKIDDNVGKMMSGMKDKAVELKDWVAKKIFKSKDDDVIKS